jgi:hypothetical protein
MNHDNINNYHSILLPWFAAADMDERYERLKDVDPNNENEMKRLIEEDLVPSYYGQGFPVDIDINDHQIRVISGLQFALKASDEELEFCWESMLPAFDLPKKPRNLFVWINEVFEQYQIHIAIDRAG